MSLSRARSFIYLQHVLRRRRMMMMMMMMIMMMMIMMMMMMMMMMMTKTTLTTTTTTKPVFDAVALATASNTGSKHACQESYFLFQVMCCAHDSHNVMFFYLSLLNVSSTISFFFEIKHRLKCKTIEIKYTCFSCAFCI